MIAALHKSRSRWVRPLGEEHRIPAPRLVDVRSVTRRGLLAALKRSSAGIEALLERGLASGGPWRRRRRTCGATYRSTWVMCSPISSPTKHPCANRDAGPPARPSLLQDAINGLWQWTPPSRE
jgi:hypothetical protein